MKKQEYIIEYIDKHSATTQQMKASEYVDTVEQIASAICQCFEQGNKLLVCGNGGSASDAQHIVAEFVVRFETSRKALPAIALNTNGSILTATANDFDDSEIFARQVEALGKEDDILLAISTSGNSANILKAIEQAREAKLKVIVLSGKNGGQIKGKSDIELIIPSDTTSIVQEMHIMVAHMICGLVDKYYE